MRDAPITVTACVRGADHIARGWPGQDAVAVADSSGGHVVAVADGAGTRRLSHEGSRAAADAAARAGADALASRPCAVASACGIALREARDALILRAQELGRDADDLASTLSVLVVGERAVAVATVGDGINILRDVAGNLRPLAPIPASEFANVTSFLTSRAWEDAAATEVVATADVDGILLSTDGPEPLLMRGPLDARWPLPSTVHGLLDLPVVDRAGASELERFLRAKPVQALTGDDCTLAIVRLSAPAAGGLSLTTPVQLPSGRRGRLVAQSPALLALDPGEPLTPDELRAAIDTPPQVWRTTSPSPRMLWPIHAVGNATPWPVVPRPEGGPTLGRYAAARGPSARTALAEDADDVLSALHATGRSHGSLSDECWVVCQDGRLLLADMPASMLRPANPSSLEADRAYVTTLRTGEAAG